MSLWVDQVRPRTKPHAVVSGSPALPPFLLSSHSRPARPLVFRSFPPYPPSFALFEPSPVLRERAASASAMCVHPHHSLPPSLCLLGMAGAGRPPPFPSSPRFSNFPSSGHLSAAVAPPPPPHRSFSLSFPATDRRSRINQTPSAFGFRPVGRSVNVRVRLPDRSSDDDLAGWSARSDRQTDEERPWQSVNILTRGGWRRQRRPVHLVRRSRRGETSTLIW